MSGKFRNVLFDSNRNATVHIVSHIDNVAGVKLPIFEYKKDSNTLQNEDNFIGLVRGGRRVQQCSDQFTEYLQVLIRLASLQNSFHALNEALKITNRRVNAIENVTLPKFKEILDYINRLCALPDFAAFSMILLTF